MADSVEKPVTMLLGGFDELSIQFVKRRGGELWVGSTKFREGPIDMPFGEELVVRRGRQKDEFEVAVRPRST